MSNSYDTTIKFATSTKSTHYSKPSGVLHVTHFSQRRGIWNDIWLFVVIVLNIFTRKMFTNREKRFSKSWMHSTSHIEMSKSCSRNCSVQGNEQKLFNEAHSYKQNESTTCIGKHVPISVSISPNLIMESIFLCNANPHHLIWSFITALEGLATQSKTHMKLNF